MLLVCIHLVLCFETQMILCLQHLCVPQQIHTQTTSCRKWRAGRVLDNMLTKRWQGSAAVCCCPSPTASGLSCAQAGSG